VLGPGILAAALAAGLALAVFAVGVTMLQAILGPDPGWIASPTPAPSPTGSAPPTPTASATPAATPTEPTPPATTAPPGTLAEAIAAFEALAMEGRDGGLIVGDAAEDLLAQAARVRDAFDRPGRARQEIDRLRQDVVGFEREGDIRSPSLAQELLALVDRMTVLLPGG
jgi:hypothetical protein